MAKTEKGYGSGTGVNVKYIFQFNFATACFKLSSFAFFST